MNKLEEEVMWSDAPKSMIQGVGFWLQDRALGLLHVCAKALQGLPEKSWTLAV